MSTAPAPPPTLGPTETVVEPMRLFPLFVQPEADWVVSSDRGASFIAALDLMAVPFALWPEAVALLAVVLACRSAWRTFRAFRRREGVGWTVCRGCRYRLDGLNAPTRCPECGRSLRGRRGVELIAPWPRRLVQLWTAPGAVFGMIALVAVALAVTGVSLHELRHPPVRRAITGPLLPIPRPILSVLDPIEDAPRVLQGSAAALAGTVHTSSEQTVAYRIDDLAAGGVVVSRDWSAQRSTSLDFDDPDRIAVYTSYLQPVVKGHPANALDERSAYATFDPFGHRLELRRVVGGDLVRSIPWSHGAEPTIAAGLSFQTRSVIFPQPGAGDRAHPPRIWDHRTGAFTAVDYPEDLVFTGDAKQVVVAGREGRPDRLVLVFAALSNPPSDPIAQPGAMHTIVVASPTGEILDRFEAESRFDVRRVHTATAHPQKLFFRKRSQSQSGGEPATLVYDLVNSTSRVVTGPPLSAPNPSGQRDQGITADFNHRMQILQDWQARWLEVLDPATMRRHPDIPRLVWPAWTGSSPNWRPSKIVVVLGDSILLFEQGANRQTRIDAYDLSTVPGAAEALRSLKPPDLPAEPHIPAP